MLDKKLPSVLSEAISQEILEVAKTDLQNNKFATGYVVLTKDKLIVARAKEENKLMLFRGYKNDDDESKEWELKSCKANSLDITKTINGGILVGKTNNGDVRLATFSNHCYTSVEKLVERFNEMFVKEEKNKDKPPMVNSQAHHHGGPPPHRKNEDEEEQFCPKCGSLYPDPERKICPKCMDRRSIFFKTLRYFKPFTPHIIVMVISYLLTALLNLVWPYLNGTVLYDNVLSKNEDFLKVFGFPAGEFIAALGIIVITMAIAKLTMQGLGVLHGVLSAKIVPEVVRRIKSDVFKSMGSLSIGFYNSRQTGSLMTRITSDAERVTSLYLDGIPFAIINTATLITTVVVLLKLNLIMGLIVLGVMPLLVLFSFKMFPAQWNLFGKRHRAERSLNGQIHDNIMGARVVKSFGQQKNETKRFYNYSNRVKKADMAIVGFDNRYSALYNGAKSLLSLLSFGLGAYFIVSGKSMTLGVLITFTSYVDQLSGPLDHFSRMFRLWADSMNAAQRLFEIIEAVPDINEKQKPVVLDKVEGNIELRNVTFGYEPHRPVLKNINLKIDAEKMIGIVGRSGAGKTTMVNLISRLYDPDEGEIYLDGVNIKDLSFEQLRKNVAMVSQETYIFIGTVAENIAYSNPNATRSEIIRAARLASAHDFICKMSDGYDTVIGSSGRSLSGGERQRISIARAILANPKILILDEATASVDTETEKAIQKSINYLIQGRTTISIAHRLSTLRDAEHLAVIDDGKIIEQGTAKELMEQKGTYYKLRELQTKALAMKGLE